jgi:hypothetical protein
MSADPLLATKRGFTLPRHWLFVVLLSLVALVACGQVAPASVTEVAMVEETAVFPPTDTPPPTAPLPPTPTPTAPPTAAAPAPPLRDLSISAEDLHLYPVPYIAAGDQVTVQVIPHVPDVVRWEDVTVHLYLNGAELASSALVWRNISSRPEALFEWVWDTTGLVGEYEIQVVLNQDGRIQFGDENRDNNRASLPVVVQPGNAAREASATWVTAENACCVVHALTGTAAYRDLSNLLALLDRAVQQAAAQLSETPQRKIEVYFVDRVIGQGGYAGSSIVVSYLDRQYNGEGLYETLTHEAVHVIDRQFAPRRIAFLAEGVAVWATGGHYKPEDLTARSAALVRMGEYVPLTLLANDFYPVQHEIG